MVRFLRRELHFCSAKNTSMCYDRSVVPSDSDFEVEDAGVEDDDEAEDVIYTKKKMQTKFWQKSHVISFEKHNYFYLDGCIVYFLVY